LWAAAVPEDSFGLVAAVPDQFYMDHLFKFLQARLIQFK
jgi:hypothetical protein